MADNYFAAVGGVVLRENRVLLVRHTYGSATGRLLIPSGHIGQGELPYDALRREIGEETGVTIDPIGLLTIRCSASNWWMVFLARHAGGEPRSDGAENSQALYMDIASALECADVTDTSKTVIKLALEKKPLLPVDCGKGRVLFV